MKIETVLFTSLLCMFFHKKIEDKKEINFYKKYCLLYWRKKLPAKVNSKNDMTNMRD